MSELRKLVANWRRLAETAEPYADCELLACAAELEAALDRLEPHRPPQTYVRPLDPPHIRHAADSPLLPRTVHLDSGPGRPTNPEDDGA